MSGGFARKALAEVWSQRALCWYSRMYGVIAFVLVVDVGPNIV